MDFAAEDITVLMICAKVGMSPLFGGSGESLYMKKWPPTLFLEFVSDRYEDFLCTAVIIYMTQQGMIASGCVEV